MKNLIYVLSLFILASCGSGSQNKTSEISGVILNPKSDLVTFKNANNTESIDSSYIDEDGAFTITLDIEESAFYLVNVNQNWIYIFIEPERKMKMDVDAENVRKSLKFSGDNSIENNYMVHMAEVLKTYEHKKILRNYNFSVDEYLRKVDSVYQIRMKEYNKLVNENKGISELFIEFEQASIQYGRYSNLIAYGSRKMDIENILPNDYFSFMDSIDMNNDKLLQNSNYSMCIRSKISFSAFDKSDTRPINTMNNYIDYIEKNIYNKNCKEFFLENLIGLFSFITYEEVDNRIEYFRSNITKESYVDKLERIYGGVMNMKPGSKAPYFECLDLDSNIVSINDFKGKFIYLDLWATWCAPCIKEFEYMPELISKYKGKDIEFVNISLYDKYDDWKKFVEEKNIQGTKLLGNSKLRDEYNAHSIPTFCLIDKEGKIIINKSPQPSDPKLVMVLDSLLGL